MTGWVVLISLMTLVLPLIVIALTFDSGPDWLHTVMLGITFLSGAVAAISLVTLVVQSINTTL